MVDILLATYNGEKYIKEQINSIIAQTYKNWRLIIHDDQSSDATVEEAHKAALACDGNSVQFCGGKSQIQITVNAQACQGAAANFIGLLQEARGEYAMFCDQDDVWNCDKIEKTLKCMKKMEKKYGTDTPILLYTDLAVVDDHLQLISSSFIEYMNLPRHTVMPRLLFQNNVTGCTVLMNRALYKLLQEIQSPDQVVMHDHFAALTAAVLGKVGYLKEATIQYRQHGDNSVGASDAKSIAYLWKRYRQGKAAFRQELYRTMIQAAYFYELYEEKIKDQKIKKLIRQYSLLYQRKKRYRTFFYIKNHVIKYGWIRAVMQIIWG